MAHRGIILTICCHLFLATSDATSPLVDTSFTENDGILSVSSTTATSITLNWTLPADVSWHDWSPPELKYRFRDSAILPPTLKRHRGAKSFAVLNFREDYAQWVPWNIFVSVSKPNEITIEAQHFIPNKEYEIEVRTYPRKTTSDQDSKKAARILARTKPDIPEYPPRTGAGCFHVYNRTETSRLVKIYVRPDYRYAYELRIYEERDNETVAVDSTPTRRRFTDSAIWRTISLKRNYFLFRSLNGLELSEESSVVNVPPQDEILSAPPSTAIYKSTINNLSGMRKLKYIQVIPNTNYTMLSWRKPDNITVTNYTIFCIDTFDGKAAQGILDFVHLPGNETSFVVESDFHIELGLSVNTETSSSGLQIVQLKES